MVRQDSKWQVLELNKLISQLISEQRYWITFIDNESIMAGLYLLPKGTPDQQEPHQWDEVYYVLKGTAKMEIDGSVYAVDEQSVIYIQAEAQHRFTEITEDLLTYVVFSKATPVVSDEKHFIFSNQEISSPESAQGIVNRTFLDVPTISMNLESRFESEETKKQEFSKYPQLMYIRKGNGELEIDGNKIDVSGGNIIYIKQGVGFRINNIVSKLDILSFFAK